MELLTTMQASALLNVTPTTLRAWQERYSFPASAQSNDGRRRFVARDVIALQAALASELSLLQAMSEARAATSSGRCDHPPPTLRAATP